jgi:hypothetical protein
LARGEYVSLFGPKESCPHCGHKVRKSKDPADFLCPNCSQPGPWASEGQVAAWNVRVEARGRYRELLEGVTSGVLPAGDGSRLAAVREAAGYSPDEIRSMNLNAFDPVAQLAVGDDILTPEESSHLASVLTAIGLTWDDVRQQDPALAEHAFVSAINGGQLPEVSSPHILPKKGEIVHYECAATLMEEVAVRQWRGGYSGFSFPIGKTGIRYRIGGTRGQSVEVGTRLNVADTGLMSVTNKCVVYAGSRKTVEMLYSKLVNLTVYKDGLQFHLSNRVNAPLFTIPSGTHIVAAIVNAAAQQIET